MDWTLIITGVLGLLGGGFGTALFSFLKDRKAQQATAEEQVRNYMLKVLEEEREDGNSCEEKVEKLTARIEQLIAENAHLRGQVTELQDSVKALRDFILTNYSKVA